MTKALHLPDNQKENNYPLMFTDSNQQHVILYSFQQQLIVFDRSVFPKLMIYAEIVHYKNCICLVPETKCEIAVLYSPLLWNKNWEVTNNK